MAAVIPTNEQLMIAIDTAEIVSGGVPVTLPGDVALRVVEKRP
jgi:hypothetical protein